MSCAIRTYDLTKVFRHTPVLNAISLQVPEGSIYGLVGPNGAGKTTTIKVLMKSPTSSAPSTSVPCVSPITGSSSSDPALSLITMTLDIGCGKRKIEPDAVGIDMSADSAADHVWNLDRYPWPLADSQFSRIHMWHVIEHLEDPMRAMAEVYRVAQDGADVSIVTPHFSSHNSYTDPTHRRHLSAASFEYFTGNDFPTFAGAPYRFEIVECRLTFGGNFVLDNMGRFLAGRSLKWYERHAAWIFPALDIRCHLRARKPA